MFKIQEKGIAQKKIINKTSKSILFIKEELQR